MKNITSINTKRFALKNNVPYNAFIWLGKNFIQLAISKTENAKVEALQTYRKEKGNITKDEALEVFGLEIIKKAAHCYIGLESRKFTLIPIELYAQDQTETLLSKIYPIEAAETVASQKITPIKGNSIFTLKRGTKNLIENELKDHTIFHAPSSLLIAYQQLVPPNINIVSFARIQEDEILISVFQNKQLQLHTSFDIENIDDAIYAYFNSLEQLGLQKKNVTLNILGNHSQIDKFNALASANVASCKLVNRLPTLQYNEEIFNHPTHHFFNLFTLLLCA